MQQPQFVKNRQQLVMWSLLGGLCVTLLFVSDSAFAGDGGAEFVTVWDTLKGWIQGTLGRVICGAMVLVGMVAGIARQSLMAFAIGIGGGIGLYNLPVIVEAIMSATLPVVDAAAKLTLLSNGLG